MDDDRSYRITRRRNPTTRINLRDVVIARDDRRTERDLPVAPTPTTGPLSQTRTPTPGPLGQTRTPTPPAPPPLPPPPAPTGRTPTPSPTTRAPVETRAPTVQGMPPVSPPAPRRHPQGTASLIERRVFGGLEIVIEHRGDEVTMIIPGAGHVVGTRAEALSLIAGLVGRA